MKKILIIVGVVVVIGVIVYFVTKKPAVTAVTTPGSTLGSIASGMA